MEPRLLERVNCKLCKQDTIYGCQLRDCPVQERFVAADPTTYSKTAAAKDTYMPKQTKTMSEIRDDVLSESTYSPPLNVIGTEEKMQLAESIINQIYRNCDGAWDYVLIHENLYSDIQKFLKM